MDLCEATEKILALCRNTFNDTVLFLAEYETLDARQRNRNSVKFMYAEFGYSDGVALNLMYDWYQVLFDGGEHRVVEDSSRLKYLYKTYAHRKHLGPEYWPHSPYEAWVKYVRDSPVDLDVEALMRSI